MVKKPPANAGDTGDIGASGKNPSANAGDTGDMGLIPGSGRSHGGGNVNLLQNPMDRRVWQGTIHGVAKSWT